MASDYAARAEMLGLDSPEDIKKALAMPNAVILDVRTQEEIDQDKHETDKAWAASGCTPVECHILEKDPESVLPDKDAPVVIHCRSGRRAVRAKEVLLEKGYKTVVNAGGLEDIRVFDPSNKHSTILVRSD
jgi:phage shock protein E